MEPDQILPQTAQLPPLCAGSQPPLLVFDRRARPPRLLPPSLLFERVKLLSELLASWAPGSPRGVAAAPRSGPCSSLLPCAPALAPPRPSAPSPATTVRSSCFFCAGSLPGLPASVCLRLQGVRGLRPGHLHDVVACFLLALCRSRAAFILGASLRLFPGFSLCKYYSSQGLALEVSARGPGGATRACAQSYRAFFSLLSSFSRPLHFLSRKSLFFPVFSCFLVLQQEEWAKSSPICLRKGRQVSAGASRVRPQGQVSPGSPLCHRGHARTGSGTISL